MTTPLVRKVTPPSLAEMKAAREKIVMVTAYDYPAALAVEEAGADITFVGDSGAQVELGYDSTVPVTMEEMLVLAKAVRRGTKLPLFLVDLPFGSIEVSDEQAVANALRLVKEGGAEAVKIEGGGRVPTARMRAIVEAGIPVMGHIGLTPQTATALGGFKAQGRSVEAARKVRDDALAVQAAGAFATVVEAVPAELVAHLATLLTIPMIGIGAGPATDGQVLVLHDLVGLTHSRPAKFVKRYANLLDDMTAGIAQFAAEVKDCSYPGPEHGYGMPQGVMDALGAPATPPVP
jgi:3-methyl-2-oxobutanoate hydroxymethyltransferase